ncbi:Flp family type IVb pilin [Pseudoduganella namucuonensis]|uniref:Pilus assembly protein Flp/PilA n=1 Tax=Pseudoduganella namucuonensis TaxID=1035707 RepID=A0A1I7LL32_9BURK|nr:Flp family type IVb pilin [Pseudoduganella namucuonensis]SFV10397.1 pilus assembly protein Flp/PilA [Pseudoduganella namucuonensis]
MNTVITTIRNFARDEEGITAIEYGLIAAVMALGLTTLFTSLTGGLDAAFDDIVDKLTP